MDHDTLEVIRMIVAPVVIVVPVTVLPNREAGGTGDGWMNFPVCWQCGKRHGGSTGGCGNATTSRANPKEE